MIPCYLEQLDWVHSLPRFSNDDKLETMHLLLKKLGQPQNALKFAHIAGTNGKGSAAVMLSCILREAGYKTGLNISPYVLCFRERFQINGEMISEEALAQILYEVRCASEDMKALTEFEAVTAAALLWFARESCDIVCLEVGLGGRLDATNAIQNTLVACIMHIARDHTELLGDTLDKIAAEKCAIFKNQCDVVVYPQQDALAMETILSLCAQSGCAAVVPDMQDFYFYKSRPFENRICYGGYDLCVPFCGVHQAYNASVALEAALCLWKKGFQIEDEHIIQGIANARFPARIERISASPLVLLDGAHNPDGAEALRLEILRSEAAGMSCVMGVLHGKNPKAMLAALKPCFGKVYTVTPDNPRAMSAQDLAVLAGEYFKEVKACASVREALALAEADGKGVCVCGSLYLAGEARDILLPK